MPGVQNAGQRAELLALYKGLRVADVRDGMDWCGMMHYGSMTPEIRPLWRTRAYGIARTARYLPFEGPVPHTTGDAYTEWSGWYYGEVCVYPWVDAIQPGDFVVLDLSGVNAGLMGSNNALAGIQRGAHGYVTSDGVAIPTKLFCSGFRSGRGLCRRAWCRGGCGSTRWTYRLRWAACRCAPATWSWPMATA